ncbi:protein BTG3 [Xyrichtys novacula]|uniref:Protein BTG3 n=1 Tax=Xyrichtys novacula TaxID=13765 RepID=A0AAV1FW48_XYRNO|nr:protein BTG3 [Xyrichtys novacula]
MNMKREIAAVVFFLKRLVKRSQKLEPEKVELFVEKLAVALQEKFKGHWYPETPSKGQAYRCIRMNCFDCQDPVLLRACQESGIHHSDLGLPLELTLWVDPGEVCCRYGEQNPCFSVATFSNDHKEDKDFAKKMTSALQRVTSDYHSGSSSDEEGLHNSPLTVHNSHCTKQNSKTMNPAAPTWHPKKRTPGKSDMAPCPHYTFKPHSRGQHTTKHVLWVPPSYRRGPAYWNTHQHLAHCYS